MNSVKECRYNRTFYECAASFYFVSNLMLSLLGTGWPLLSWEAVAPVDDEIDQLKLPFTLFKLNLFNTNFMLSNRPTIEQAFSINKNVAVYEGNIRKDSIKECIIHACLY